jgi:lysophospholipase L1-like esterase
VAAEYVDLRALYDRQADQNQWGPDGLHPTPAAYSAWADALYAAVPSPCGR